MRATKMLERMALRAAAGERVKRSLMLTALSGPVFGHTPATAQELPEGVEWEERHALVLDDEIGAWRFPTPASALRQILDLGSGGASRYAQATAVLTQRFESRPRAELDALADELVRLAFADDTPVGRVGFRARFALGSAARADEPYEGAFPALVRLYEMYLPDLSDEERRTNPLQAIQEARGGNAGLAAQGALHSLFLAESEGRGRDYLIEVIEAAAPPESVGDAWSKSYTWCAANDFIFNRVYFPRPNEQLPRSEATTERVKAEALAALPLDDVTPYVRYCGAGVSIFP
ncbi:hypothetical protein [Candidatus Palauibacter sp.]|uniref:hypothetical protein n=1 Tax=Candidatus Palauibacter sp. TaxID=3101350 RepID=UPI003B01A27F